MMAEDVILAQLRLSEVVAESACSFLERNIEFLPLYMQEEAERNMNALRAIAAGKGVSHEQGSTLRGNL